MKVIESIFKDLFGNVRSSNMMHGLVNESIL